MRIGYMYMHWYGHIRWTDFCQMQECYNSENNQEETTKLYLTMKQIMVKNRKAIIENLYFLIFFNSTNNNQTIEINIMSF